MRKVILFSLTVVLLVATMGMAADKVVIIPMSSNNAVPGSDGKVWGEGRPGAELLQATTGTGYCTTASGINYSLSDLVASWNDAASACPANTYVCPFSDIGDSICPITYTGIESVLCDGTNPGGGVTNFTNIPGWIADSFPNAPNDYSTVNLGASKYTEMVTPSIMGGTDSCRSMHVYCCWE